MLHLSKNILAKIYFMLSYKDYCNLRLTCVRLWKFSPIIYVNNENFCKNSVIRSVIYNYNPPKMHLPKTTKTFYIDNIMCMYHIILNKNLENIIINKNIKDKDVLKYIDIRCKNLKYLKCNIKIDLSLYNFAKTLKIIKTNYVKNINYPIDYIKCKNIKNININTKINILKCFHSVSNINKVTYYNEYIEPSELYFSNIKELTLYNCDIDKVYTFRNIDKIILDLCSEDFIEFIINTGIEFSIKKRVSKSSNFKYI